MKEKVMQGKPYAGNPHVRFDEGADDPKRSGRSALQHRMPALRNVPATYKLKGAAALDGPWEEIEDGGGVGRAAPLRFFKVEVRLP